jgi:alpha-glucosidase
VLDPATLHGHDVPLSMQVTPELAKLPVYVRGGSILPIAPLIQSTNETPKGPLTLRVFVGDDCSGQLYQDDGKTYAFQNGEYLRMKFSCKETAEGLRLEISQHEGSYPAWWKEIDAEIYGWVLKEGKVSLNGKAAPLQIYRESYMIHVTFQDDGKGAQLDIK